LKGIEKVTFAMNEFAVIALAVLAASSLAAAWPLARLPRFRRLLEGVAGSGCVALGSGVIGFLVSGLMPFSPSEAIAFAAEDAPAAAAAAPETDAKSDATLAAADPVLHTPIEDIVKIPEGRPAWTEADPDYTSAIHTIPVASGPYVHENESRRALDQALVKATREYVAEQLGSELAARLIQYDAKTIKRKVVKADNLYHDEATYSVGKMHEYFALLEFGPEFRNELDRRWENIRAKSRLSQVGLFGGAGLLFLASIFGYFRMDNATRGYYTGRLQFMTAATILAIVGAGAVLAQWIHWL
jgi:hypothetical protein